MAEAASPLVTLDDVVVRYPGRPLPIGPLTLSIAPGEIIALVGASGSGKSTTLRLLAGLEPAAAGRIVSGVAPGRIGFVFQSATLMPWASALDNVALPLVLSGARKAEAQTRAREALVAVGLGDRLDARPGHLSGGMAMRVSLARALVTRPSLILLDEPFAALDSITRRDLIEDLHRLWSATLPAVVFVTHDVEEAAYLARRVVVLNGEDGRVTQDVVTPGALPRPPGWRATPDHLGAVETVAAALARAMGPGR